MGSLRDGAIRAKILIWGPPGGGKATTLQHVGGKLKGNQKGPVEKVTLEDPSDKYELLPVELGEVKGVPTKLDFQTVPGAWEHAATRKKLLQGVDGIIFVANASGSAMKDNQKSLAELDGGLKSIGRSLVTVPVVFQWMNHKAIGSTPPDEMHAKLNRIGAQAFLVPENEPTGMLKAFAAISKMAVKVVRDDYEAGKLSEAADPEAAAPGAEDGLNPFDGLADDLSGDLGEEFGQLGASAEDGSKEAADGGQKPSPVKAVPSGRNNGAGRFRLLRAGEPSLSGEGVLSLPLRIGNDHGDEIAVTVTVKVIPDA